MKIENPVMINFHRVYSHRRVYMHL
jgi:hypothetical protein